VTVTLKDGGGTANNGSDSSASQTFNINISKPQIWHNSKLWTPANKSGLDVNDDGHVVAGDALAVINYINSFSTFNGGRVPTLGSALPTTPPQTVSYGGPFGYLDVNGDGSVSPIDALTIINVINANQGGEGEAAAATAVPEDTYFADLGAFPETPTATMATPAMASVPAAVNSSMDDIIALLAADSADQQLKRRLGL